MSDARKAAGWFRSLPLWPRYVVVGFIAFAAGWIVGSLGGV